MGNSPVISSNYLTNILFSMKFPDFLDGSALEVEELLRQGGDASDRHGWSADNDGGQTPGRKFSADRYQRPAHGSGLRHNEQIFEQVLGTCEYFNRFRFKGGILILSLRVA